RARIAGNETWIDISYGGGLVAPLLWARVDHSGTAEMRGRYGNPFVVHLTRADVGKLLQLLEREQFATLQPGYRAAGDGMAVTITVSSSGVTQTVYVGVVTFN